MSERTWKRNTTGIAAHAQARREHKHKGVEEAIATLLREQKLINFNTVAKAAAVSKAYLYSQPDLRERIEALRQQTMEQMVSRAANRWCCMVYSFVCFVISESRVKACLEKCLLSRNGQVLQYTSISSLRSRTKARYPLMYPPRASFRRCSVSLIFSSTFGDQKEFASFDDPLASPKS